MQLNISISFKGTIICNILLPKSLLGMSNLSVCHLTLLFKFYGVLYTPTPILGYILQCFIADRQSVTFEFVLTRNILDSCQNGSSGLVTKIVNHMFITFAFSLQYEIRHNLYGKHSMLDPVFFL